MWAVIGTWRMPLEGIEEAAVDLENKAGAGDALEKVIRRVEDFPYFKSVGYGGLPNEDMEVELDAGFMDGDSLSLGAVACLKDFSNPISIARRLSEEEVNCFLVGQGAEKYAHKQGFERKNMLTDRAKLHYRKKLREEQENRKLKPYDGHDTVGVVCLDTRGKICAGTSTSGLFMKKSGRVGDSPMVGSGFYADSDIGGACATGLGEDLMKGCISYEIVRLMEEGKSPQQACDMGLSRLDKKLKKLRGKAGDLSVVAIDKEGNFGIATNIKDFSFVYASENKEARVYLANRIDGKTVYKEASQEWVDNYIAERKAPIDMD